MFDFGIRAATFHCLAKFTSDEVSGGILAPEVGPLFPLCGSESSKGLYAGKLGLFPCFSAYGELGSCYQAGLAAWGLV